MKGLLYEFALHMQVDRTPLEIMEYHQLVKFVDWVQATRPEYDAAPEMYAMLMQVRDSFADSFYSAYEDMVADIDAILARAKGDQP